jgi:radical SAM superfamily enzyme YgiQ (UPF0313 family)
MKVLLVHGNQYELMSPPPVGLSLLTEPLRRAGHEVYLLDLMKEPNADELLVTALDEHQPELVGFSLRNLDNQSFLNTMDFVPDYKRWVSLANNKAPTIIGGSAVMSMPEALFEHLGATYAIDGQADKALVFFLDELKKEGTDFKTPGLLWRKGNAVCRNSGDLSGYPRGGTMDWSSIDFSRYRKQYFNSCVITKTGCPYRCLFCDAGASFGTSWAPREPEAIIEDLHRDAREYGFHRLDYFFIDALFNEPVSWAKSFLEALIRSGPKICYSAVIEPTATIDRELARLMRRAGCGMVTCLLNSMDDGLLKKMRRPFTVDTVNRAFRLFDEEKINYMPQFLLGSPGETRETIATSLKHLKKWKPIMVDACYGIRVMPKAGMAKVALEEGIIENAADLLKPTFYLSDPLQNDRAWLDRQIKRFKRFRMRAIPRWANYMRRVMAVKFQK